MRNESRDVSLLKTNSLLQKKKNQRSKSFRKYVLAIVILIFMYIYVAGDYGLYQLVVKKKEEANLSKSLSTLTEEAVELQEKKDKLEKKSPEYMEKVAREKYGMAKKGEKIYKVVKKK